MKKIVVLLCMILLTTLVGCKKRNASHNASIIDSSFGGAVDSSFGDIAVQEITLKDGTKCVIANVFEGVSISCNWR